MTAAEETLADYAASGVTVRPHLMAHLRPSLDARGVLSAAELAGAANATWVKCAGVVIVRQRPGTASGFMFLTLEDETGIANAIVTPDLFQANRTILHRAQILLVEGPLQKQDGVIHVRARRFTELKTPARCRARTISARLLRSAIRACASLSLWCIRCAGRIIGGPLIHLTAYAIKSIVRWGA